VHDRELWVHASDGGLYRMRCRECDWVGAEPAEDEVMGDAACPECGSTQLTDYHQAMPGQPRGASGDQDLGPRETIDTQEPGDVN